jgi:DHA1 family tetracycline resistance protein-like MFS transporter
VWLLCGLLFTDTFGYAIVLPLLPLEAERRGAGILGVGWLFATYSLCQLLCAPVLGRWSDRCGRRPVLVLSMLGSAAGFALMLPGALWPLALSRLVDGATAGNVSVVNAVVLDTSPRAEWGRRLALLATATGLGILAGIAASALLAAHGLRAAALVALGLSLVSMLLVWRLLPETAPRDRAPGPRQGWRQLLPLAARVHLAVPAGLAATTAQAAFLLALPVFLLRRAGFHEVPSGIAIAGLVGLAAAFQAVVVTWAMGALGVRRVALGGFALALAGGVLVAVGQGTVAALAAAAVLMLGVATLAPALTALIGLCNETLGQGAIMGLNQSVASAGQMAGPLLSYAVLDLFPTPAYGILCAALAAAGALLVLPTRPAAEEARVAGE